MRHRRPRFESWGLDEANAAERSTSFPRTSRGLAAGRCISARDDQTIKPSLSLDLDLGRRCEIGEPYLTSCKRLSPVQEDL